MIMTARVTNSMFFIYVTFGKLSVGAFGCITCHMYCVEVRLSSQLMFSFQKYCEANLNIAEYC